MKVLFLGNSHTFYNDMPQIFAEICKERGKNVEVQMQAHPGVTYGWHYSHFVELRFSLMYGNLDYIVMQQAAHSPCPSKKETMEDAGKIINLARKYGVTPVQIMPWAEKKEPAHQKVMYDTFYSLSKKYNIKIAIAGNVFEDVFYNHPEIDMYWYDGRHASPYGSYTVAMSVYSAIFNESVKGLKASSYCTYPVSLDDWNNIQNDLRMLSMDPENKELQKKASQTYEKCVQAVMEKDKAYFALDPQKAEILQDMVDKYNRISSIQ